MSAPFRPVGFWWLPLTAVLWAGWMVAARAQEPGTTVVERQRITVQREQANAAVALAERECQQRFAVTACVDEARRQQREALASLRRQQAVLDDGERRQRAAARAQAIRERISSEEAQQRNAAAERREPRAPLGVPKTEPRPTRAAAVPERSASAVAAERQVQEARSRARFDAQRAQAKAHREAAEQRAAERQRRGAAAAPLPVPSAPAK